mgnify:CR=1 FL=1
MTKIYLVRHAEAEGNLYRIAQGQYDSMITDRGFCQIAALEKRFEKIPVDAVYSSDLFRTCITAGAVCRPKHLPLNRRRDLREICVGDWEQKTWGDIALEYPEMLQNFSAHLDQWHIPGAETPEQVRDRILNAVREIAAKNDGKTAAVFSHGCAIRILLATLQGFSIAQLGQTPLGANTAVSMLEADGDRIRVVFRDDVSHLRPETGGDTGACQGGKRKFLDPGLRFEKLCLPEETDFFRACVSGAWADSGDVRPLDPDVLLREAQDRPTLVGLLQSRPVGLLQMNPRKNAAESLGWISLYCMEKNYRARGYGIQLLGQAVQYYRPLGRQRLCLALAEGNVEARRFFTGYGFQAVGQRTDDGREIFQKDIGFPAL